MLFKILIIISLTSAYGFINNRFVYKQTNCKNHLYKTIIYDNNYGSEFDSEMSDEEKGLHREIKTEEANIQYIKNVMKLQKYQTMYKLLKYLVDTQMNTQEKIMLLKIFKKEIDNIYHLIKDI
jgi:hypothetical protein